jgi:hypothetical protein
MREIGFASALNSLKRSNNLDLFEFEAFEELHGSDRLAAILPTTLLTTMSAGSRNSETGKQAPAAARRTRQCVVANRSAGGLLSRGRERLASRNARLFGGFLAPEL